MNPAQRAALQVMEYVYIYTYICNGNFCIVLILIQLIQSRTNSLPHVFPPVIFDTPDIFSQSFFHPGHVPSRSFSTPDIFPPVINLKMPFALNPLITQNAANIEGIIFQLLKKQCKITLLIDLNSPMPIKYN